MIITVILKKGGKSFFKKRRGNFYIFYQCCVAQSPKIWSFLGRNVTWLCETLGYPVSPELLFVLLELWAAVFRQHVAGTKKGQEKKQASGLRIWIWLAPPALRDPTVGLCVTSYGECCREQDQPLFRCGAGKVGLRQGDRKKSSLRVWYQKHKEIWAFPVLMG